MIEFKKMIATVFTALSNYTELDVSIFYLPNINYKGYVITFNKVNTRTDNTDSFNVEGAVFKTVELSEAKDIGLFEFAGRTITTDNCNITFEQEVNFLQRMDNQTDIGFVVQCKFSGLVTIPSEHSITKISTIEIDVNNSTLIIEQEDTHATSK